MIDANWIDQAKHINDDPEDDVSYNLTKNQALGISKKIKDLTTEINDVNDTATEEIGKLRNWQDQEVGIRQNQIERLNEQLLAYYRINKDVNTNFKFISPYVKVVDRKTQPKWLWNNEDEIISSLENSDQDKLIKVEKKIDKKEFKKSMRVVGDKVITSDGSVIQGVSVTPAGRSVTLKVTED